MEKYGAKCFIYNEKLPENELQIDHRVPFEVAGDSDGELNPDDFMLLSPSANREKTGLVNIVLIGKMKKIEMFVKNAIGLIQKIIHMLPQRNKKN